MKKEGNPDGWNCHAINDDAVFRQRGKRPGREQEKEQASKIIRGGGRKSVVFLGEPGVGKTTMLMKTGREIARASRVNFSQGFDGLVLDVERLVNQGEGAWRQHLADSGGSRDDQKRLILIDDSTRRCTGPFFDAIARTIIGYDTKMLATANPADWADLKFSHPTFTSLFQEIHIPAPEDRETAVMARAIRYVICQGKDIRLTTAAIDKAIAAAGIHEERIANPKATVLLLQAAAKLARDRHSTPSVIAPLNRSIAWQRIEVQQLFNESKYDRMLRKRARSAEVMLKETENELKSLQEEKTEADASLGTGSESEDDESEDEEESEDSLATDESRSEQHSAGSVYDAKNPAPVLVSDVVAAAEHLYGRQCRATYLRRLRQVQGLGDRLQKKVFFHELELKSIEKSISSRLQRPCPTKPLGVFLLAGDVGSGRSSVAAALAVELYPGITLPMLTIDAFVCGMSDTIFNQVFGHSTSSLSGGLVRFAAQNLDAIILVKRIDEGSPRVIQLLENICMSARYTDLGSGVTVFFRNTVFVMTGMSITKVIKRVESGAAAEAELGERTTEEIIKTISPSLNIIFDETIHMLRPGSFSIYMPVLRIVPEVLKEYEPIVGPIELQSGWKIAKVLANGAVRAGVEGGMDGHQMRRLIEQAVDDAWREWFLSTGSDGGEDLRLNNPTLYWKRDWLDRNSEEEDMTLSGRGRGEIIFGEKPDTVEKETAEVAVKRRKLGASKYA